MAAANFRGDFIPLLPPRAPDDDRLLIVLDMDDTLIHSVIGEAHDFFRFRSMGVEPSFSTILPCENRDKATMHWFEKDRVEKPERLSIYKRPGP